MDIDLRSMSISELKTLGQKVEKAIETYETRRVEDARKEMEKIAKSFGVTLSEVIGGNADVKPARKKPGPKPGRRKPGPKPKGKPKAKAKPKFKNPEDASQTWTGRGRQPAWYKAALAAGKTDKDLAV